MNLLRWLFTLIGLEPTVELPSDARANLASFAKPLIDGTIAAFHAHDDLVSLDLVAGRIEEQIGVPAAEISSLLSRTETAILGSRRLLWKWREGVQWNPADDRCSAFRIRRLTRAETDRDNRTIRIRGSLVELAPRSSA